MAKWQEAALLGGFACAATALGYYIGVQTASQRKAGKDKMHKRAFMLVITIEFHSVEDRDVFTGLWQKLATVVAATEPNTLAYELAIADTDPNKIIVFERYTSKTDLTAIHQQSDAYKAFKKDWDGTGIQLRSKTGQSYYETDLGYM